MRNIWNSAVRARVAGSADVNCNLHIKGGDGADDVEFKGPVNAETAAQVMSLVPGYGEVLGAGAPEQRIKVAVSISNAAGTKLEFDGVASRSLVTDMLRLATGLQCALLPQGFTPGIQ